MVKEQVAAGANGVVVIMDSITKVTPDEKGAHVVSASHGGASSGEFALAVSLGSVFFNDAGGGKDSAGIAALGMLETKGVAAGTVSHESARIGDSQDMWEHGTISHVNAQARALGLKPGDGLRLALLRVIGA